MDAAHTTPSALGWRSFRTRGKRAVVRSYADCGDKAGGGGLALLELAPCVMLDEVWTKTGEAFAVSVKCISV